MGPTADCQTSGGSPRNNSANFESRQDSISQIPNPGNILCDESAMPQKQVQLFVNSHQQGGSPRGFLKQPPSSAFAFYPTERNAARTPSVAQPDHGGQKCFLQDPCVSNLMVGEPGASSQSLCEMGISDDFSLLDPPFNDVQFNPYDILDPPFNGAHFASDNTSQGCPPSGHFEPCRQVSCALGIST